MSYLCLRKQRKILNKRAMAIIDENIRGKVGNSVFYRVGSITRVRSAAANYLDANTIKQQENRSRLRVAIRFYQRLVEIGLQEAWYLATQGTGKNGYNFFLKLNMMVFKPNGKIGDFARLQLTVGMLQKGNHLTRKMRWFCHGRRRRIFLPRGWRMSWWLSCFMPIVRFLRNLLRRTGRREVTGKPLSVCRVDGERRFTCTVSSGRRTGKLILRANTLGFRDFRFTIG